jgi:hypothetical protein
MADVIMKKLTQTTIFAATKFVIIMKTIGMYLIQYLALLSMVGCGDNKTNITDHKWQLASATAEKPIDMNNRGVASTDLIAQGSYCIADDIFVFRADKSFLQDDNENKCEDSSNRKGTWDLMGTDSILVNFGDGRLIKFKIKEVTSKHLSMVANMKLIPGGIKVTYAFKAIN